MVIVSVRLAGGRKYLSWLTSRFADVAEEMWEKGYVLLCDYVQMRGFPAKAASAHAKRGRFDGQVFRADVRRYYIPLTAPWPRRLPPGPGEDSVRRVRASRSKMPDRDRVVVPGSQQIPLGEWAMWKATDTPWPTRCTGWLGGLWTKEISA